MDLSSSAYDANASNITTRIEPSDKVRKRINVCRAAGMEVVQDFIGGITEIRADDKIVLHCVRQPDGTWRMEYNLDFWEEIPRD